MKKRNIDMSKADPDYGYFLKADLSSYEEGEWIAISGKKIIAHGKKGDIVHKKAKKLRPKSEILMAQVPPRRYVIY